jgi:hypothetical protein
MIYTLVLGWLNQRRGPTVVAGGWDAAGLLLGLSGFLALGGPAMLTAARSAAQAGLARDGFASLRQLGTDAAAWSWLWAVYVALLVTGAIGFVVWRRRTTVIYHVEPEVAERALTLVLDRQKADWRQQGTRFVIGGERPAVVECESFEALQHVTLHWHQGDTERRREIELALAKELAHVESPITGVSGWLLSAATACFVVIFGALALIFWVLMRIR